MILIVMGVVGAGKTTIGQLLAQELGWQFSDADDFHPQANIEKIRRGLPLNDEDRRPWLNQLRELLIDSIAGHRDLVLACSALKRSYRQILQLGPEVRFVYLKGSPDLVAARLHARSRHFADEQILASQFADLEEPNDAITVDIGQPSHDIVREIRKQLGLA